MAGMSGVGGIPRISAAPAGRPVGRGGSGFRLPPGVTPEAAELAGAAGAAPVGLMTLQEADEAAARDRRGAARARHLLKALAALQAGMLRGEADPQALEQLASLAEGESPADPVLADALAGIALRARVELARRGIMVAP